MDVVTTYSLDNINYCYTLLFYIGRIILYLIVCNQ